MGTVVSVGFDIYHWIYQIISIAIIIFGVWGMLQVVGTRDDAFIVIDRKKQNWMLLNGGAALTGLVGTFAMFPLWIVGAVIVGIYWQDVRPAIRDVLDNSSGSW